MINVTPTIIPELKIIEPRLFRDERGLFYESFNLSQFEDAVGYQVNFVQDNHSKSKKNVLRGLHYQIRQPQGKLIRVTNGEIFDVAVDVRKSSKTFGASVGVILSSENKKQFWIPEGFAHGFLTLSDEAEVLYKTTNYYSPEYERSILWNDPQIDINWPHKDSPILSTKDQQAKLFAEAEMFI